MTPAIFRFRPEWENRFSFVSLIEKQTSVQRLQWKQSADLTHSLYAKREDQTDTLYGGNKVRNCEFLLGDVLAHGHRRVTTVAPLGSNFVAALVAQAKRVGVAVEVEHFIPTTTPQILAHAEFSHHLGAQMRFYHGRRGALAAATRSTVEATARRIPFISPGGSHPLGVLGHINAMLELGEQVERGELPRPDILVTGVGTCGTLAGLLLGRALLGWDTQILGVRCVDKLVCHARKVRSLANATARRLGLPVRLAAREIRLFDLPRTSYGLPAADWQALHQEFEASDGLSLDTTYTGKVMGFLSARALEGAFRRQNVLYWHTFSPCAMRAVPHPMSLERLVHVQRQRKQVGKVFRQVSDLLPA